MAKSKGLTRPITRKQALSYTSTTPNGMGVTAIASVNGRGRKLKRIKLTRNARGPLVDRRGRGSNDDRRGGGPSMKANRKKTIHRKKPSKVEYQKRYASTKMILRRPSKAPPRPRASKKRIFGIPAYHVGDQFPVIVPPFPRRTRRASTPKETVMKPKSKSRKKRSPAQRAAFKRMLAGLAKYKKKHTGGSVKRKKKAAPKRTHRHAAKRRARRNGPVAAAPAVKTATATANKRRRKSSSRAGRSYTKYRSVVARVGKKKLPTYVYQTKRGTLKHIPLHAVAGVKSARAFNKLTRAPFGELTKSQQKARRRVASVMRQRERAASRVGRQGDIFTPNRKGTVVPYETWSASMTPNPKRRRAKKRKATHPKRRKHAAARRPVHHRKHAKHAKRAVRKHSKRSASARKAARTRARNHEIRVKAAKKAARTRKRRAHRNPKVAVANRRRRHHHVAATPNRRKRKAKANRRKMSYLPIRVARFKPNRRRRHYTANPFKAGDFKQRIFAALKVGALAAVGFGVHRAATKFLSDQVLAKMGMSTGPLATYRGLIAGLIVAGASIPLTEKVLPKQAGEFNSGVFVSFAHSLLTTLLNAAGQTGIAAALSAYPDAEGKAYHGMGEYMPVSGFGAYEMAGFGAIPTVTRYGAGPMLSQAAAGFGNPMLSQAAAGFGAGPMLSQAAAGFGAPMLSQAAAGTGEYLAQGVQGIGDYEMVSGVGSAFGAIDDGIRPDLRSAERALNVSEAAAGVSLGDLPTSSQLNPVMLAQPVEDAPEGMRSGILQGGDGIFG